MNKGSPPPVDARRAAALMKAFSNEARLRILSELLDGERCVNELEKVVGLSQSALSQHLARLRGDQVVKTRRVGKTICYSLNGKETSVLLETLYRLFAEEDQEGVYDRPSQAQADAEISSPPAGAVKSAGLG